MPNSEARCRLVRAGIVVFWLVVRQVFRVGWSADRLVAFEALEAFLRSACSIRHPTPSAWLTT